ncbi:Uncharacterised protein [Vibrio cholerae]|nr:Uncharacterised protein [Vibrio cholerae]CSI69571.1 Uncharacterised protein [Vibrio cholerae]
MFHDVFLFCRAMLLSLCCAHSSTQKSHKLDGNQFASFRHINNVFLQLASLFANILNILLVRA